MTLVFINPNSKFLHIVIRDSAKYHFHFSNPFSSTEQSKGFIFSGCLPNTSNLTQSQMNSAVDEFDFIFDKTMFGLYKSVNDGANHDTVKFENKKAKKLFFFAKIALFIAAVSLLIFFYYARSLYSDYNKNTDEEKEQQQEKTTLEKVSEVPEIASKVFEVDMQQKQLQQQNERLQRELELYKQRLPQDYQILSSNDDLRVSAAVSFNGTCKAYNVRGDLLNISQSECEYILAEKGRMIASSSQSRTTTVTSSNTMLAPATQTQSVTVPVTLQ